MGNRRDGYRSLLSHHSLCSHSGATPMAGHKASTEMREISELDERMKVVEKIGNVNPVFDCE